jgi:sRNA-binding protein
MIETRHLEGDSHYQAARDMEVLGKKSEALAGYEALSKDWPEGFSDEKARIDGLKYDIENAQKEWADAEAAEAANDLPKALEHYKNSERFYAGMKDGAARIERLQTAIRAAGTSGGTSGGD